MIWRVILFWLFSVSLALGDLPRQTSVAFCKHSTPTFQCDANGNLTDVIYPAFTSVYQYDALNERTSMTDPVGTTTFTWTPTGQLATETGPWTNSTVSNSYNQGHRTGLSLTQPGTSPWTETYGYDSAWRMTGITSGAGAFGYQYPSSINQYLVGGIALPNGASILNQYDTLSRLTNTALLNSWGHPLDGYVYGLDMLGLRTNITRELGLTTNIVSIAYDPIAEVTSWMAKEANNTPRQNEQLSYGYDAGGNLQYRTNNALVQTFTVDSLNQLSNVTRAGTLTVTGALSGPSSNVTVNGINAQTNGDFTFAATNNTLANGTNIFTNVAANIYTNAYSVIVTNITTVNLPTNVTFQYDSNGNLTSDGTRSFAYDAENRLTNVQVSGQWRTGFVYDGLGRRRIREDYTWVGGSVWVLTNGARYICDGMVAIQERDTNNNVLVTYTRGLDLSGSLQGAGGIGGLLARTDSNGPVYYHGDGSGNITALIDGNGNIVARYEYDAFGRVIGKWGAMADENRYQFSSMEYFPNAGLVGYYGRFYDPILCRWLNHDPIGERGGINLYGFVGNNPVNNVDPSGLSPWSGWWNPFNYSSGWAQSQGVEELNAQLAARDTTLQQFQLDNPTWNGNGNLKAGNMQVGPAAGNLWAAAANGEINAAQIIVPAGIVTKAPEAAAQGIADAAEQGWLSKLWNKCKFWKKAPNAIGSTGKIGEQWLAQNLGGESQVFFNTSLGGRYVDQLANGIANESKVGYMSLTQSIQVQIAKDVELMNSGAVQGVTWHFFQSPVTGLGGPSQPLLNMLQQNGINVVIH